MPYSFQQYPSLNSQDCDGFPTAGNISHGISNSSSTIISASCNSQPTYLPTTHLPQHVQLNQAAASSTQHHLHLQHHHQQQQQHRNHHHHHTHHHHHHHPPPSPPASITSSYSSSSSSSSSSLSSPTLPPASRTTSPPPAATSNIYSYSGAGQLPSSITPPPPRMVPFGYTNGDSGRSVPSRMHSRKESEESEVYPLDLSVRSAPKEENGDHNAQQDQSHHRQHALSRHRHAPRLAGVESSRYKHHQACMTKNCACSDNSHNGISVSGGSSCSSSRSQQRLSPYPVPLALPGGVSAHSPSSTSSTSILSRSPVPLRTDSPIYGRRRTPSPAYYNPSLLPDGGYRMGGVVANGMSPHLHHHQQHFQSPAPPQMAPSPSLAAARPEHSSSPSPFQILTTANTVLHGTPTVSGLFKPYQEQQVDAEMTSVVGSGSARREGGVAERQGDDHPQHHTSGQHQNHDPRRQLLRQLQQQQEEQQHHHQNHLHQPQQQQQKQQQQEEEEEERTYVDLDSPSQAARSAYPAQHDERSPRGSAAAASGQSNGGSTETPMEVTNHTLESRGLSRQTSVGFGDNHSRRESEMQDSPSSTGPFYKKSELLQKHSSNNHESHHYLRQAFMAPSDHPQRERTEADKAEKRLQDHLSHHHLQQQQQQQHNQQQQQKHMTHEEEEAHHQQQHSLHQESSGMDTTTTPPSLPEVPMAVSSTTADINGIDGNTKSRINMKNLPEEVIEEAKLLTFLSKTTLVTLKPNGQLPRTTGNDCDGSSTSDHGQKGYSGPSVHNIFRDFHGVSTENESSGGKLPKFDTCLTSATRAGRPSSCKGSLLAPKKICFRLVDLVGLLVEQSLRA